MQIMHAKNARIERKQKERYLLSSRQMVNKCLSMLFPISLSENHVTCAFSNSTCFLVKLLISTTDDNVAIVLSAML